MTDSMRIVSWTATNFKKVKLARVTPKGHVAIVGGQNAAGKSSVLDALMVALVGKTAMPAKPVREGAESAEVTVECDDVTIRRRIKPDGSGDLTITTKAGDKKAQPQTWLDQRIGKLGFDPLQFVRSPGKEQADTLRKLVGVDVSALDAEKARVYEERTVIGREGERAKGHADSLTFYEGVTEGETSIATLMVSLREAQAARNEREALIRRAESLIADAERAAAQVRYHTETGDVADDVQARKDRAQSTADGEAMAVMNAREAAKAAYDAALRACDARDADAKARLAREFADADAWGEKTAKSAAEAAAREAATETAKRAEAATIMETVAGILLPDEGAIQARMADLEETNRKARANAEHAKAKAEVERVRGLYAAKTARLAAIAAERQALIQNAAYPVDGLGFDADGAVTYNGIPLSQASQAEQIRVSMAIGLAMQPELRLVLIRDASLLDDASMALVAEMAEKHDALVVLERVGDGDAGAVVIEDGEVR